MKSFNLRFGVADDLRERTAYDTSLRSLATAPRTRPDPGRPRQAPARASDRLLSAMEDKAIPDDCRGLGPK